MKFAVTVASIAALAASVHAANISVQVGQDGDQYSPLSTTASAGDNIVFTFHSSAHNVIESAGTTSAQACQPLAGGFATPIMNDGTTYTLPINSSDPVYIHCGPHCKSEGMIFVVNPPSSAAVTNFQMAAEGIATSSSSSSAAGTSSSAAASASSSSGHNGAASLSASSYATVAALTGAALMGVAAVL